MKLRVFRILKKTKVEGPKTRYCIWVQGCSRHCLGCSQPQTWSFNGGKLIDTKEIISDILNTEGIEGVTFLGGEPFEQPEELGEIAQAVKQNGLGVLCFTGDLLENLVKNPLNKKLLDNIDLLIDGEFQKEKLDYSRPWCGSSNQRYHFLTDRYNNEIFNYKNKFELNITENGTVILNGMGDFEKILQQIDLKPIGI